MQKLSFAVIGAGPAAFYISKCLAKLPQAPVIHIFEKEYCPFGLIRYGVAPDHISIKKTETTLSSIIDYPHFRYFGNHGVDNSELSQLKQLYSGVIFATGAQKDNQPSWLPLLEEKNRRIYNSRQIVYWYNNHPQYEKFSIDLSRIKNVVIIGNGNVAIDIARIFLKPPSVLEQTEISRNALNSLKQSKIANVMLVARRGFTNSAFALKEIRQLTKAGIQLYCFQEELEASMNAASHIECTDIGSYHTHIVRMNKRKIDFIKQKCKIVSRSQLPFLLESQQKKVILRFLLDPVSLSDQELTCAVTSLEGEAFYQRAVRTDKQEKINFDMLVNSTGFKVESIDPEEYDEKKNCISNSDGCVVNKSQSKVLLGQYAVGWCKSGPKGVIDQTLLNCQQTFNNIRIHVNKGVLLQKKEPIWPENKVNFFRYLELKEFELSQGNKEQFIKKKLSHEEVVNFFQK